MASRKQRQAAQKREIERRNKAIEKKKKKKKKKKVQPAIKLRKKGVRTFASEEQKKKILETEAKFKEKEKKKKKVQPTIKLEPKKEETRGFLKTLAMGPLLPEGTELKTGMPPAITPAGGAGFITKLADAIKTGKKAAETGKIVKIPSQLKKIGTKVNVNAIGKSAGLTKEQTAALATQIGRERINVIARYAVNPKSTSLTKKFLIGLGFTAVGASITKDIIGTYPFAAFIGKEETAQTLGLPMWQAIEKGDVEGAKKLLAASNEIVLNRKSITDKIPYLNVLEAVNKNIDAVEIANEEWARIIDIIEKELEEPTFAEEREAADIEAFERKREFAAEEEERFEGIAEEREEGRQAAELRQQEERELEAEYFRLIREKRYEEAEEILKRLRELAERPL